MWPFNRTGEDSGPPAEVDVQTAADQLRGEDPPVLLDVREVRERDFCLIENSLHIPTGDVPQQWESLPRDKPILVYCHHGMRSLRVTRFLRQCGLENVQSIKGGIDAWSLKVDASVGRY
jgi:rhodanese-related sulfurtransferase